MNDSPEYDSTEWALRLEGSPDQVVQARRLVSATLGRDHPFHDDCVLLTSEVATNAVLHSRSGDGGVFVLAVSCSPWGVRVSVRDEGSAQPPLLARAAAESTGGRGLPLLDALAHRWGVVREAGTSEVWFELLPQPVAVPMGRLAGAGVR
ncbi:ATP-binding protein [Planobispora siamensis]|uniref:ATP-binding protein n=1 Tax=Planobispora siamensis TaxID=936338 RepID=A0A8J3WLG0_9ACTN|nr:ATP-binding protein [Planobispora siamensis]GIH93590.1 ATP-binding protein [Planobispora siamensis]